MPRRQKTQRHSIFLVPAVHNRSVTKPEQYAKRFTASSWRRYAANFAKRGEPIDKEEFKRIFAQQWSRVKNVEPLIMIYCLATMGSYHYLVNLRREDIYPAINAIHMKRGSTGKIVPIHSGLMDMLNVYFKNTQDKEDYPFNRFLLSVDTTLRTRFGYTHQQVRDMRIDKPEVLC